MNSYRVAATGENRVKRDAPLFHVDVTIEARDEQHAAEKAIVYLNHLYDSCSWRTDAVNQVTGPARRRPPTKAKPRPKRRSSRA